MFLLLAIPLVYSVILYEISHGLVASRFGDDTARHSGRLSLSMNHIPLYPRRDSIYRKQTRDRPDLQNAKPLRNTHYEAKHRPSQGI